jgi:hypothetical protein
MIPSPRTAAPLLTDDDVAVRVESIVGPALRDGCVWLLLVDGDRRQAPTVIPIDDSPRRPERHLTEGLRGMLARLTDALATAAGPGSCVFVLERLGHAETGRDDEEWAEALDGAAAGAGLGMLGVFLSTPAGVRRVR